MLYRDSSGNLIDKYWISTSGWNQQILISGGMSTNPAAIVSPNGTNMNVFYGDSTGKLGDEY